MNVKVNQESFFARELETNPQAQLRELQDRRLHKLLEHVLATNPFYSKKFGAAGIRRPVPLQRLADLPFTTKAELVADQLEQPPYGTDLSFPLESYTRLHQSSGTTGVPLRWLDTAESWDAFVTQWCFVYRGAGVEPADRVFVAFSFGPFSGFWAGFEAADELGCLAITGGGQTTEQRLVTMSQLRPTVLVCTPTYALRLAETARAKGIDTTELGVRVTIHAGEPGASIPATRLKIEQSWNAKTYDHVGMTEMGAYGYECQQQLGPHVNESEFIAEFLDPQTGQPVADGERGEVVLTNLFRAGSPLIRYRTGDLAEATRQPCECGRTFSLLRGGILGRADDMITIRGINVFPSAIENILRRFPEVVEFQGEVIVDREMHELVLVLETDRLTAEGQQALAQRLISELHTSLHLRPSLEFAPVGSLPRTEMKSRRFQISQRKGPKSS
ncbi:MAG: phenylacetate--CoA ligase family protein [Acidobacteria bacterium]|nr:phenylacetate--CoA ligase family protein [Acidobacteriota bacterium]